MVTDIILTLSCYSFLCPDSQRLYVDIKYFRGRHSTELSALGVVFEKYPKLL